MTPGPGLGLVRDEGTYWAQRLEDHFGFLAIYISQKGGLSFYLVEFFFVTFIGVLVAFALNYSTTNIRSVIKQ